MTAFVYVMGPLGGPFKIGYTQYLSMRLSYPQAFHFEGKKMYWLKEPCPSVDAAKQIEKAAHSLLKTRRLIKKEDETQSYGRWWRTEWFDVTACQAIAAVKRAIADHAASPANSGC